MRFLVDEDLPRSTQAILQKYGHDAFDVRDIGLRGAKDHKLAAYAKNQQLCILTDENYKSDGIVKYRRITSLKYHASVLFESWKALRRVYYESYLYDEFQKILSPDTLKSQAKIKKYFKGRSKIGAIRNDYGFHFDPIKQTEKVDWTVAPKDFEILITLKNGPSLCTATAHTINASMLKTIENNGETDRILG